MVDHLILYIVRVSVSQPSRLKTKTKEWSRLYFFYRQDLQDQQDFLLRQRFPDESAETQSVWRKFSLFIRSAFQYFSEIKQTIRLLMP
jgi:hypothetical protein